jgi:subtilisin-like proprotein convertase family protein
MKLKQLITMTAGVLFIGNIVMAQSEYTFAFTNGFNNSGVIPDGDPSGLAISTNLTGIAGSINNLTVSLNISGGFNGDLYAYLTGPNGGFAVLLNRVGVSNNASMFGYGDSGLNVTFSDASGNDFHFYQNVPSYDISSGTVLWQPDGRNIDPQSDPNLFLTTPQTALLNSFQNDNANGTWTLFLADLSSGGQSTLVSWGLDITTVPEPATWALTGLGLAAAALLVRRKSQN